MRNTRVSLVTCDVPHIASVHGVGKQGRKNHRDCLSWAPAPRL